MLRHRQATATDRISEKSVQNRQMRHQSVFRKQCYRGKLYNLFTAKCRRMVPVTGRGLRPCWLSGIVVSQRLTRTMRAPIKIKPRRRFSPAWHCLQSCGTVGLKLRPGASGTAVRTPASHPSRYRARHCPRMPKQACGQAPAREMQPICRCRRRCAPEPAGSSADRHPQPV